MPIKVLPPDLANKIAAGEVVERPASVVKELLENSLDALASQVTVEIQGGGVREIRVTDDGHGIAADQLELAFQRHATSKLEASEQLEAVGTLGFRGEALPSIAAVSQMTMTTRTADADAARSVQLEWGAIQRLSSLGAAVGTSVRVADLFGNLPARRKFLKSNATETGRVQELVSRYALAYPQVRFLLNNDGRRILQTPGSGNPRDALVAVYGAEAAGQMLEVDGKDPESGYEVEGFVGAPGLNRANRTHMSFFVNHRWIQSRMLSFAVEEAYHGLLPERRYPLAVVNLSIPFDEVDVNFHPSKREVRFHQEGKAFSTLQRAVRAVLVADSPVPRMGPSTGSSWGGAAPAAAGPTGPSFFPPSPFGRSGDRPAPAPPAGQNAAWGNPALRPRALSLRVVGQVKLTYIVAESPDGMLLVDQHAAHERVVFDRLIRDWEGRTPQSQALLDPAAVDLTPAQMEILQKNAEMLTAYGFILEPFGDNCYVVRGVPAVLADKSPRPPNEALVDVLDMVGFEGLLRRQDDVVAASIACHSAIRAGKSLTEAEMQALLEQLEGADNPHTCPHGRPTMVHFSSYQMEREFGRR